MSNPLWTSQDAQQATGSTSSGAWTATGISIDTRTLQPGDIFVALNGPNFDGHEFVDDAFAKGAAAAIVSNKVSLPNGRGREAYAFGISEAGEGAAPNAPISTLTRFSKPQSGLRKATSPIKGEVYPGPLVTVPDTLQALRDLAKFARARSKAKIIALTGSVGKTGTKEALRHVLSFQGQTHASAASFNNHWGAPLSLALLPPTAKYAIFELGMNHPGEIEPLSKLVCPHVAIVTNVEAVHLGPMGSLDAIAEAKAEIFAGLEDGIGIVNQASNGVEILERHAKRKLLGFCMETSDAFIKSIETDADGSDIIASIMGQVLHYRVPLPGAHNAENSLAVLLSVHAVGGDVARAAADYATLPPVGGRGDRSILALPHGTITLIDETHNASPVATRAALKVLGMMTGVRRIAVLGDMLELGPDSPRFHAELAKDIEQAGVDLAFLSGSNMAYLYEALPAGLRGHHAPDSTGLLPFLQSALREGDIVLVKGSRGSKMKIITDGLRDAAKHHAL